MSESQPIRRSINVLQSLTAEEYMRIGRMTCAIVHDSRIGNDHTAFRELITMVVHFAFTRQKQLSARKLGALTDIASSKTIDAGRRLEEIGLISSISTGSRSANIYEINEEAFDLPPIHPNPSSTPPTSVTVKGRNGNARFRIVIEEVTDE